jgi:hypothetical protein
MAKLFNIENLKFGLSHKQYEQIYEMYKEAKLLHDIANEMKMPYSRIAGVVGHINAHIISRQKMIGKIYENPLSEEVASYKDLLLEVDDEPTIGSVVIVDKKILHNNIDITNKYKTLKHYF